MNTASCGFTEEFEDWLFQRLSHFRGIENES